MRYPKSQLKESQYTSGGDFIIISSSKSYSGYYWEVNGRFFIGKNPSQYSEELKKITIEDSYKIGIINNLPSSFLNKMNPASLSSLSNDSGTNASGIAIGSSNSDSRYFSKQTNTVPALIREITQDTFNNLQSNPIYQTVQLDSMDPIPLDKADNTMPGLKLFLSNG